MTAQIISLLDHRRGKAGITLAAKPSVAAVQPQAQAPATPVVHAAPRAVNGVAPSIAGVTEALSAACREMAVNLAMMISHADAACATISKIGETADALAAIGADLKQAAASFREERDRTAAEIASEMG